MMVRGRIMGGRVVLRPFAEAAEMGRARALLTSISTNLPETVFQHCIIAFLLLLLVILLYSPVVIPSRPISFPIFLLIFTSAIPKLMAGSYRFDLSGTIPSHAYHGSVWCYTTDHHPATLPLCCQPYCLAGSEAPNGWRRINSGVRIVMNLGTVQYIDHARPEKLSRPMAVVSSSSSSRPYTSVSPISRVHMSALTTEPLGSTQATALSDNMRQQMKRNIIILDNIPSDGIE